MASVSLSTWVKLAPGNHRLVLNTSGSGDSSACCCRALQASWGIISLRWLPDKWGVCFSLAELCFSWGQQRRSPRGKGVLLKRFRTRGVLNVLSRLSKRSLLYCFPKMVLYICKWSSVLLFKWLIKNTLNEALPCGRCVWICSIFWELYKRQICAYLRGNACTHVHESMTFTRLFDYS